MTKMRSEIAIAASITFLVQAQTIEESDIENSQKEDNTAVPKDNLVLVYIVIGALVIIGSLLILLVCLLHFQKLKDGAGTKIVVMNNISVQQNIGKYD